MESIKVKSNARKSTYSGKPSVTNQEQMRMRQALKPEPNANHVPVKASPTTWKRSGWSLSARVRHGSREGLLTPMVITKDKESKPDGASSNGDIHVSSRLADTENVARSERKSPDQRSLWSLFSAPKVQENVAENTSQVDPISSGISRASDEMLTPHHVQKLPSRDPRIRKREESEKELKTSPPSFNLLSKMKPLKNASRNFFAHLGKKPDVSVSQDVSATSEAQRVTLDTQKETENAATEPLDSRLGNRTSDVPSKKHLGDSRTDGAKMVDNPEQNCKTPSLREEVTTLSNKARTDPGTGDKKETSVMVEYSKMGESDTVKTNYKGESAPSDIAESVPVKQKHTRDSPVAEDMKSQTNSLAKQEEGPSKDLTMPTLTLPPDIEHGCYASDVSSELDESDILFIDEQAHADCSSDGDEDSNKVQDEEESHVLRVWSLQSTGETSSDFQNVDQSSSFSGDASSSLGLDDSLPLAGNESLNSWDVSKIEKDVRLVERLHEDENSGDLSKSNSEKIKETDDAAHTCRNTESSMLISRNSEEGPPKLQAQPNTHHLLQELDSLLECSSLQSDTHSNMQLESSENSNMLPEASGDLSMLPKESKDSNMPLEANEEMSETDSLNHSKESESSNDTEPARNIFSLFSSGKRPLSPKNIVKLDKGKPREQSNSNSYRSAFSKDSIVLSGSCSGERNRLIATEDPEDASKESPDTGLSTLSGNESSDTGLPTLSGIRSPETRIPSLTLETCTGDGLGSEQNDICLRSSQPPELCLEVIPSSLGEKEVSHTSTIPPEPEEYNVEDISFLAFESRDDLFAYSKTMKLKMQRKSTQTNKVTAKKFVYPAVKNVKMKKKKKNPMEAKIKAFEQDLLWSMESRGLTEIVHPVLSRKGVALDTVKKNDLVVNVRNEELERISHKKWRHKTKHRSETEVSPMLDVRWQGKHSNAVEISRSKHGHYSSLHVRKSIVDKDHETEHVGKPSDTGKVVGLKHGHYHGLEKNISKIQSSGRSDKKTEIKKSKPKHSSNRQEWEICPEELHATSERPSLKLKFISKAKANSTSPTKVEQSPLALSTKPRESTVPLKSPTSHIPVNVQQLHVPSSSATPKNVVHVASKPVEEKLQPAGDKPQPVEDKPQPSKRLPEEESLPFKPYEKPVASKKSAFVSDALEDLLQGVDINNKLKPLISPSTISVSNAKVVFKVPSRQSHSVKTLDMALKRQKPLNVSSPNYRHDKIGLGFKNSYDEQRDEKKKKKKKKDKHKDRIKEKIKKGYVFGTGPDDLVRKLPKLPFACYGKTYARPLFAREQQVSNTVGKKSKGFLEVRNVLSLSGKATVKRQSDEVEVQSVKKIKQEPKESDENLPPTDENLPPILNINLPSRVKDGDALKERSQVECTESKSEEAPSETRVVKKCEEYCRLGCICSSLNDLRTVQEMSSHCRKVDCMFDCLCKKNSSQAITGTRIRRPPTYSHDMLFYDDSYKFWKGGDNESTSTEVKKLQLLDHLPECEKRNLVSTCARTRTFVPDKPEKWIKWKRKQLGDEADQHLERKRASESQVTPEGSNAHNRGPGNESKVVQHLASEDSLAHSTNNNQSLQNETQVSAKQQKLSRKHQFIPLAVPSKMRQQNQLSNQASKADDFKSKVKNVPAQTTVPLSCAKKSTQENASTSQVLSTFIPVAKQYLLNGNLMNMVVLPNGNRVLLPANTCPPFTVKTAVEQKKTFLDPEVSGLAPKLECAQNQTSTIPLQSAKLTLNTSVQSTPRHEIGLKLPIPKSGSSVSCVASGLQRPVLPLRYQITSSGIIVAPGVVAVTSAPVTRERSPNISQGKLSQTNKRICQTSSPSENCGLHATVTSQVLKAPVSSTRTESGVPLSQAQQTELPQLKSNVNKISLPSQTYVVVNPPVKAKTCAPLMTTSSKQNAADSKPSPQGCISISPASTESVVRSAVNVPKQEHSVSKPVNQDCSPSESESHEDMEETHSTTCRKFPGDSEMNDMRITKTFFMDLEGKSMYIMISTDAKCEWTDAMESEVKQAITKFLDLSKSKEIIHLLKDMELNLWDKGDRWIRLCLTKHKPSEKSEDVMADESKSPTGNNTEAPNASEEGNLKTIASSVTQTSSAVKPLTPEDKIHLNDGSSNIGHDPVASRASNDVLHVKQHDSQHPLGTVPVRIGKDAEEATSNAVQRSMPITSLASESSQSVTKKLEINSKDATLNVIERTPSKTCITVGASRSSSERTNATSKTHDKSSSMSDNGKETSKKLSSSLPEFDKLSEIVKRTSVDDDDGLSPIKKTTRNVAEWLHDPKIQKPCEKQNYSGVKGPWFTTEKEGVKVVLQRNKGKRSPFGKGGKSPSKPIPQRIMKRSPSSSSVLVTSPKKSPKHEEMAKQSTKDNDSNSQVEKSLTKDEAQDQTGVPSENPETTVREVLQKSEESVQKGKKELFKGSTEFIPKSETTSVDRDKSSDSESPCYLSESSGLFVDNNANDSESTSTSQIEGTSEEEASEPLVNRSKKFAVNEEIVIGTQSEQHNKGKASIGSFSPEAISPSPDAKIDDRLEAEKEIAIDDTAGTLGIEHFARFSEEDAYGPLDFDEEVSASFNLPADCNDDDNSSIASLRIDDGTTEDISNADLGKNILSSPKDHSQESTEESSEVKDHTPQNLPLPANSKVNASTDHSAGSRASSLSHMKDEVCTDSPHNDSQSSKAESNFDVGIPPPSKNAPEVPVVEESLDTPSAAPEHTSENQPSIPGESIQTETAPVKNSDIYPKKSPMLNIKFVATSNENCTSPICTSPVCPSPVCQSPLLEDLTENTQDRLPTSIKSNDPSDASLSDTEIDVVNTDVDDEEIDVETVGGVTPVVPNLNPYSSLRDITSRLSSALQKEQRVDMPKRSKPKSSCTSLLKLSVGKSSSTSSFKLSIGHSMGSPRKIKPKSFRPAPLKMNQQSSLTTHVKSKKKQSKRKSPVCPAKQWDSPQFQEVYKDNPAQEEVDKSDGPQRDLRTHNILERRRREEMRKAFTELSTIIHGSAQHTVPPKIQILNKAILEVRELNMKEKELRKEKEQFKKQQRRLVYVHSNLLHHARCSGQIIFPEGSRLAESMERVRSGLSKHISTSPGDEGVKDSSPDLQGKKRKAPDMEQILDSHLTKMEPRTATSGSSCLVIVKKKSEEKNASSHSEMKRSDSTKSAAFNPFPKLKDTPRVIKGERYLPVTKKELKTQLRYGNSAEVKTSHDTVLKGNRKSALDVSMPSGSQEFSVNSYGVYGMRDHDSSSDNEETLPIDCYVSSSDEPEEYDEADFRMDDDEEQYSDDGFIPESEDEITANVSDKKFEKSGTFSDDGDESEGEESDQEVVTINIDLDDFEQDNVESRSDMESNAEVDRRKRTMPKIKQGFRRKEESSLENEDSDDVLVITKETSSFDNKLKKMQKERGTLGSKDDSTVCERNECKSQSKSMNLSRLDQVTKQVSFIPSGSMSTTNSNASRDSFHSTKPINPTENTSQDSLLSTKPINPTEKLSGVKQDRAPLVNVIDEIMNRLKGDAQPSARSSAGEERTDEALGSANIGPDILDSSSDDEEEGHEKLLSTSPTSPVKATGSIPSKNGQGSAILKHKGDVLPSKEPRTPDGGVQLPVIMLDDSDSSSEEEMDRQERTLVSKAVSIASSSVQHKVRNDSALSLKHKKDAQQSCAMLNDSDSSSDDEVDGQKSTTAPSASTLNNIRHKEAISLKTKEVAQPCGAMLDYSDSSSDDEVDDQESTKASKAVSLNSIDHEKENSAHVGEQEILPSTSHTKNSGSVPSDMQHAEEKNSVESLQKKFTVLPMKGALADLISSVKTRVTNDDASDASDDSESEDDEVSEDEDSEDDSDDEESNDDERMEVGKGKEDIDAEDDSSSNIVGSEEQDITDIDKDVAGPSYVLEEKGQRSQKPEGNSGNTNMAGTSSSALRTEEEGDNQDSSSVDQTLTDPSSTPEEKGQGTQERDKSSIGDDLPGLSFPNKIHDSFSVDGDVTDDDAACLSYAAMGNDEDNEALFDAEIPSSPFSPISLDMEIASDDDIPDTMDDLDEDPQSSHLKLPKSSASNAGISTDETKSRPQEISLQAKQSSGGHHKPSASSKQDLTLDEAISFLNVEKNSDGTLNVFLKGDYDDEKLDELFEKPEVMDYIMSAAAKKS